LPVHATTLFRLFHKKLRLAMTWIFCSLLTVLGILMISTFQICDFPR
jgi:phosphatidylserine synthase